MHRPSSPSEFKLLELYPSDWKHNPEEWKAKGLVFEEKPETGIKLTALSNARAHCKFYKE